MYNCNHSLIMNVLCQAGSFKVGVKGHYSVLRVNVHLVIHTARKCLNEVSGLLLRKIRRLNLSTIARFFVVCNIQN